MTAAYAATGITKATRRTNGEVLDRQEMIKMILLGVFILGGAAGAGGLLIASNLSTAPSYTPRLLGHMLPTVSAVDIFAAGLGLALVLCLGLWMIADGLIERHRSAECETPIDEFLPGSWRVP